MRHGQENLLKPTRDQTAEERRENARKAGIASGEARRAKREARETWSIIKSMPLKNGPVTDLESLGALEGTKGANLTVEQAMYLAMLKKALSGDVKAWQALGDAEDRRRRAELEIRKLNGEVKELEMKLEAYQRAAEMREDYGVQIIDDISSAE